MTLKIDELRQALLDHGVSEDDVVQMNKAALTKKYMEIMSEKADVQMEMVFEKPPVETMEAAMQIKYGTPEWQQFILGQLTADELVDGCPKCNGLRRVAQLYLGDFIYSGPKTYTITNLDENGTRIVTVSYEIVIDWKLTRNVGFSNMQDINDTRTFGGLADCVSNPTVYGAHPAATAETKAESRALRKALALNVVTAEEKVTGQDSELPRAKKNSAIPKALVDIIKIKADQLGFNLTEALKSCDLNTDIYALTAEEGRSFFDNFVNRQQQITK